MAKVDPYSRRELKRLRSSWLRRHRGPVALVAAGIAVMQLIATVTIVATSDGVVGAYLLGAVHVGLTAAGLHLLQSAFLAFDRDAMAHVRGAWGEDNTRSELQRAKRRRLIWGWVDTITLAEGDLDHVVVTRHGGLVAIDTKWRNSVTSSNETASMARSALKARKRAETLADTIYARERQRGARHRASARPLAVTPLVVLWGAAQHSVPDDAVVDGVRFVKGRDLLSWLRQLDADPVSKDAAADVLRRMESFRDEARRRQETRQVR